MSASDEAAPIDKSLSAGDSDRPEPKRKKTRKGEGGSGGRMMKRPRKRVMGLKSITKATREPSRTFHTQHAKLVRDPATGKYYTVRPARPSLIAQAGTVRSFHTQHARPVLDRATGKYRTVRPPRSARPYAHEPASELAARSGKLKSRIKHRGKQPATARAAPPPAPQRRDSAQNFSTKGELYQWHKANGTLAEYLRMYGLDPKPE